MQTTDQTLSGRLFAPLVTADIMAAALAAIESTLSTHPLSYRVTAGGNIHQVPEPASWLARQVADGQVASLRSGDERSYVGLSCHYLWSGDVPGGGVLAKHRITIPWDATFVDRSFELVQALGPAAAAYWGDFTPNSASVIIAFEYMGTGPDAPLPGGPVSTSGPLRYVTHSAMPARIGWINYWSGETCRLLGLTPADSRLACFDRVAATGTGGMALQLTGEPLDLTRPEHQAALDAAYDAFPTTHNARQAARQ